MAPVTRTSETKPTGQTEGGAEAGKIRGPRNYNKSGVDLSSVKTTGNIPRAVREAPVDIPLDKYLVDGGSAQLKADRQAFFESELGAAIAEAEKKAKAEGRAITDEEHKRITQEVEAKAASRDREILIGLYDQQQSGGSLGIQNPTQTSVIVDGVDVLNDIEINLPRGQDLPPALLIGMTDEPVELLQEVMGDSVGSAAFQERMQQLDEAGQKEFARNILLALNATYAAAKNDPEYAKALGIDGEGPGSAADTGVLELEPMPAVWGLMPGAKAAWIAMQLGVALGEEQDEMADEMLKQTKHRPDSTDENGNASGAAAQWDQQTQLLMHKMTKTGEIAAMCIKFSESLSRSGKEAADAAVS